MDANEFEVLIAAILVAGANASGNQPKSSSGSSVYDLSYTIKQLREKGFTHGATRLSD